MVSNREIHAQKLRLGGRPGKPATPPRAQRAPPPRSRPDILRFSRAAPPPSTPRRRARAPSWGSILAELVPADFGLLVQRAFAELERQRAIFDLPERKFHRPRPGFDLSVRFHGQPASNPVGPAAGPQSQMVQNIVLSYLAGARVLELKTIQINDALTIPRPCIDATNVGYNVEWSQELRLEQSLREYVGAHMLLEMLRASGVLDGPYADDAFAHSEWVFDMSVGYDLKG